MLRYLVEHAGWLMTREEMLEALWPETYVQPEVLKSYVRDQYQLSRQRHDNLLAVGGALIAGG